MEVIIVLLLLAVFYLWYYYRKNYKIANQNYKDANKKTIMGVAYAQLLYILMEQKKFTEKDYHELVVSMWSVDGNLLDERDFNPKWEKICESLDIIAQYDDEAKQHLSDKNVTWIASKLYHNRHLFQQYTEESERRKKVAEKIMNDPKYNY